MKLKLTCVAVLIAAAAAVPAEAATIVHVASFSSPSGYKTGTIHNDGGIVSNPGLKDLTVEVTDFDFHIDSPSSYDVFTYCVDIADYLYAPANFAVTTPAAVGFSQLQSNAILSLLTNTLATPMNPTLDQGGNTAKAAGIQLAIWEILNETNPAWNIASGSFYAGGGTLGSINTSGDALNYASTYLTNVSAGGAWYNNPTGGYALNILSGADNNPRDQNQVYLAAVPEPASWALMLAGFGAVGFAMRRRHKVAAKIRFA